SYLCPEVLIALAGCTSVRFFPVGKQLVCEDLEWCDRIEKGDAVVVIHYFGISWDSKVAAECKARGAILIRDASQALYSIVPDFFSHTPADYTIFSPRKQIGVTDGGILQCVKCKLTPPKLCLPPSDWLDKAEAARAGSAAFDSGSDDRSWFEKYQRAEAEFPMGSYSM